MCLKEKNWGHLQKAQQDSCTPAGEEEGNQNVCWEGAESNSCRYASHELGPLRSLPETFREGKVSIFCGSKKKKKGGGKKGAALSVRVVLRGLLKLPSSNLTRRELRQILYSSRESEKQMGEEIEATFNSERKGRLNSSFWVRGPKPGSAA